MHEEISSRLALRRSLIMFKFILASLFLICFLVPLLVMVEDHTGTEDIVTLTMIVGVATADLIIHVIFVVGAFMKDVKFLKVYYFYSLNLLVLSCLMGVFLFGIMMDSILKLGGPSFVAIIFLLNLFVQAYILLLVRIEINKLKKSGSNISINNPVEDDCSSLKDPLEEIDISPDYLFI